MSQTLTAGAHTDVGMKRGHNEDYYYRSDLDKGVSKSDGYLFVAADGVGGNRGGGEASKKACEQLPKHFFDPERKDTPLIKRLTDAINLTHHDIRGVAATDPTITEMSCTIVILAVVGDEAVTAHLGDARIYQYHANQLEQITKDHSWVQEQVDAGLLTPEQAEKHRNRNVVTRTLGGSNMHEPEVRPTTLNPGNRFLLCSDGLHGPVQHAELTRLIEQNKKLDLIAQDLVDHANQNGGPDNIVAIVVQVGEWEKLLSDTQPTEKLVPPKTVKLPPQPELNAQIEPVQKIGLQQVGGGDIQVAPPPDPQAIQSDKLSPGRSRLSAAMWGIMTVVFLAVCALLAWLFLSGDQFSSEETPEGQPIAESTPLIIIPPTATRSGDNATVAPTSTLVPPPTEPATLIPTNTPSTPTEIAQAVIAISNTEAAATEILEASGRVTETPLSSPAPLTATPVLPPLELLDIRCDGNHTFEPNAVINFKWSGKNSAELEKGEWMQIAIQSATKPEGIARQITDQGANVLPDSTKAEWLVPRKLSSFGIVGEGDLHWWVEFVVDDIIVDSSDTGCFRIVPTNVEGQSTSDSSTTPAPDLKSSYKPNRKGFIFTNE